MRILAIDSATPVAGVALVDENKVLCEEWVNYKKTHSQTLMPMVDQVLCRCDCTVSDLQAIAVTIGPGSFTGLRIGLAAAKGLALAGGKPLITLSTLEALAHNICYNSCLAGALLDARKQEVYAAFYDVQSAYPQILCEETACSPAAVTVMARDIMSRYHRDKLILLGDGVEPYEQYFIQEFGDALLPVPMQHKLPRAACLGSLAVQKYKRREFEDIFSLRPTYLRLSEAQTRLGIGEI
ncbi:MAG: tRNA (adenosine(37)-N6)-threonylcarbamoyltransferase complex dimerization subunit type 1 TsaB [Syntrophomonadaceae bacterium]|nr:tRNA (adenosine(37)-N6)-threonylcarbamoyltransferase complex dimerization subunit type 1 TsaB [Syntrophomonadaceae bacterium]